MYATNQTVNVTGFYFRGHNQRAFPSRIEFGNTQYSFNDGLQYLIYKGKQSIRLFDMTDGRMTYRLRCENDQWSLIWTRPSMQREIYGRQ
ncbi:MAG: hypothetical protein JWL85_582 [Candidatus Saccharibacteria bacterium]|nr:hypothetical protein [Candidatus Saccharibacteria bacterium]